MIELPKVLTDNEISYFLWFDSVMKYSDPESIIDIRKLHDGFLITVTPSKDIFKEDIIQNNLLFNRKLGLKVTYSKSLGISKKISFKVNLDVK